MSGARELVLVRHPKVSVSGVCYGHTDVPAELDAAEVEALLAKLPSIGAVWTSPLSRCAELATRIAERRSVPLHVRADLRELGFGAFEGLTWEQIEARFPGEYARWMRDWQRTPPPGGETLSEFSGRVLAALAAIAEADGPEAPSLVVTHAGVIRTLLRSADDLGWDEALARPVPHMDPLFFPSAARPRGALARS